MIRYTLHLTADELAKTITALHDAGRRTDDALRSPAQPGSKAHVALLGRRRELARKLEQQRANHEHGAH